MRILEALCILAGMGCGHRMGGRTPNRNISNSGPHGELRAASGSAHPRQHGPYAGRRQAELPERAWKEGRAVWIADLAAAPRQPARDRRRSNRRWCQAGPCRCAPAARCWRCWSSIAASACAKIAKPWPQLKLQQLRWARCWRASQERGRADELSRQQEILLDAVADGICGLDRQGKVQLCQSRGGAAAGRARRHAHRQAGARTAARSRAGGSRLRRRLPAAHGRGSSRLAPAGEENIFRADGSSFPAEYVAHPHPRPGPRFRLGAELSRHQPALRSRPHEG